MVSSFLMLFADFGTICLYLSIKIQQTFLLFILFLAVHLLFK
ncbi:hypothetical protein X844_1260 [Listeria monocytogenes Lm_1823]|nr:hypothetical protein X844_1260 [Listeria monocytogenes Lm_1823]